MYKRQEVGCAITLVLSFFPNVFGDLAQSNLRTYNIIVCVMVEVGTPLIYGEGLESIRELKKIAGDLSLIHI